MHKFLPIKIVERLLPLMEKLGVSEKARSHEGFLTAYRRANGRSDQLDSYWWQRREAFIARHMAQLRQRGEPLFSEGRPTRRHLALIAWAYSPSPSELAKRCCG